MERAERELPLAAHWVAVCLQAAEVEAVRVAGQVRGWCRQRAFAYTQVLLRELGVCAQEQQRCGAVHERGVGVLVRLQAVERAQVGWGGVWVSI